MKKSEKFIEKIEKEAWEVVSNFKERPIRSIIIAIIVIWFIKKIIAFIREEI